MELEKINYNEEDLKKMAVNASQMRDLCNAKQPLAFDAVETRTDDLERISPECAAELRKRNAKQKQIYKQTQNPACFAELIHDIEELYGRAFKLMIENIRAMNKAKAAKVSAVSSYNTSYEREIRNDLSSQQSATSVEPEQEAQAQEKKRFGLFGRNKDKSQKPGKNVEKISLSELQSAQSEMDQTSSHDLSESEKARMAAYDKRVQERASSNQKSMTSSAPEMGRQKSKR